MDEKKIESPTYLSTSNEKPDEKIQEKQLKLIVDVLGQKTEPICSYYRCRHKFSIHGKKHHGCKCKHPMNKALGV